MSFSVHPIDMKFELLAIRCLLTIIKVLYQISFSDDARCSIYDMEQELQRFKRDLMQRRSFEDTH